MSYWFIRGPGVFETAAGSKRLAGHPIFGFSIHVSSRLFVQFSRADIEVESKFLQISNYSMNFVV